MKIRPVGHTDGRTYNCCSQLCESA